MTAHSTPTITLARSARIMKEYWRGARRMDISISDSRSGDARVEGLD
jgi:hypothetical protein